MRWNMTHLHQRDSNKSVHEVAEKWINSFGLKHMTFMSVESCDHWSSPSLSSITLIDLLPEECCLLSGGPVVGAIACKPHARQDSTRSRSADGSINGSFDCRWNRTKMGHRGRQIERSLSGEVTHSSSGKTPSRMTNHSGWWEIKTLQCVTPST